MSLFKRNKNQVDVCQEVMIPQCVDNQPVLSGEAQIANRSLEVEQIKSDNQRVMVNDVCGTVNNAVNSVRDIVGFVADMKSMHERSEQMRMMTDVQLSNIAAKFETTRMYMEKAFGERGEALDKHYGVLDNAIASGDREMIIAAMQGISNIVATSPLQDIEKFTAMFNDTSQQLLDF